ncbi:MAG TPA: right-handed parallel beta-helix repeat-containing protein, partial [Candidatus Binatia bacterium]|nr:right-handed parallel beta-helix repeat-containing protein [Candidatus Binatia bacterium]
QRVHKRSSMYKRLAVAFTLVLLILMLFAALPVKAQLKTIVVPNDYPTIQQAVDRAKAGETVYVKAGNYNGAVEISKPLALIGENNKAVINDWVINGKAAILVTSNNVTISGMTIDNPTYTTMWTKKRGIHLLGANNCTITNNIVRHCDSGTAEGIWLYQSKNNLIAGNTVENGSIGISIGASTDNQIVNNTLRDINEASIYIYQSSGNTVISNILENDAIGFKISDANNNSFLANNILCYAQAINFNVDYDSYSTTDNGNLFIHNNFFASTPYPYVRVSQNLLGNPLDTQFSVIGTNYFDNGQEGNFYSRYSGKDANRDGVGDVAYGLSLVGNFSDNYPLMSTWVRDWRPPVIEVFSPNSEITVVASKVLLNFTMNEAASDVQYSLDGAENVTITENTTLTGLFNGDHNVRIFATDLSGNKGTSTVHFLIDAPVFEALPPLAIAAVSVIVAAVFVVVAGLLVYFKKRKREEL